MKSGNLNFLEPFGPLQACNGTALLTHFRSMEFLLHLFLLKGTNTHIHSVGLLWTSNLPVAETSTGRQATLTVD